MRDDVKTKVVELFGEGKLYCAETALKLIAEAGDRNSDEYVRLATGFCSGESRCSGQCGAVSGCIMGIGLYAGRREPGGDYEAAYALTQEFMENFKKRYGTYNCTDLIGCDLSTKAGQKQFRDDKLVTKCQDFVVFGVETALGLLRDHGYIREAGDVD